LLQVITARAQSQSKEAPLWKGFESPIEPKVKAWSKFFGRYLGAHVVDHPAKTFHSFRHTFARACREAGLSEEIRHALTGHSGGGVGRRYGRERRSDGSLDRGISLQRLQTEINKISYGELPYPSRTEKLRISPNALRRCAPATRLRHPRSVARSAWTGPKELPMWSACLPRMAAMDQAGRASRRAAWDRSR
jgi:hypothetical protein